MHFLGGLACKGTQKQQNTHLRCLPVSAAATLKATADTGGVLGVLGCCDGCSSWWFGRVGAPSTESFFGAVLCIVVVVGVVRVQMHCTEKVVFSKAVMLGN